MQIRACIGPDYTGFHQCCRGARAYDFGDLDRLFGGGIGMLLLSRREGN